MVISGTREHLGTARNLGVLFRAWSASNGSRALHEGLVWLAVLYAAIIVDIYNLLDLLSLDRLDLLGTVTSLPLRV